MAQDSKFIPFYSEVHPDIQEELKFRAKCAIDNNRSAEQIEWLNSRSSWGSVTLLESDKKTIRAAINNPGLSVDRNPLEEGTFFKNAKGKINNKKNLKDQAAGFVSNTGNGTTNSLNPLVGDYLATNYINSRSGRTPPALQSITFSLADTSAGAQGLLNDAQISILVPDIEYFINEFERDWLRLGYKGIIEIGHSVRTESRGNYGRFEGNLVNFNFEYQKDGAVNVVLYFKSATDLATIIPAVPTNDKTTDSKEPTSGESENTTPSVDNLISTKLNAIADEVFNANDQQNTNRAHIFPINYIENRILNDSTYSLAKQEQLFITNLKNETSENKAKTTKAAIAAQASSETAAKSSYDIFMAQLSLTPTNEDMNSTKTDGTESGTANYVSLGMIVKLLNVTMHAATNVSGSTKSSLDTVYISSAPEFSTSLYFEELVSGDHEKVVLPSSANFNSDAYLSSTTATVLTSAVDVLFGGSVQGTVAPQRLGHISNITLPDGTEISEIDRISFYRKSTEFDTIVGIPANILISIQQIRKIELDLKQNETPDNPYDIDLFINKISKLINKCTSGAINLKLTSIPTTDIPGLMDEFKNKNMLILKDTVASVPETAGYSTKPTKIPMFVNSMSGIDASLQSQNTSAAIGYVRAGTVVRNFKIIGKIPNSLKSINLILSQTSGIPKDMLAHYLTYIEAETKEEKSNVEKEYEEAYQKNLNNLIQAKQEYYNTPLQDNSKINLQEALSRYVTVPKKSLSTLFSFTSPPYPLDVEFELDGCYGFRFGDILTMEGLPAQYNKFVFSITKIDHSLLANDWTTKITCLMRPSLSATSTSGNLTSNPISTVTKKAINAT